MIFSEKDRFVRHETLMASPLDDELVMMDEVRGCYFGLNSVGRALWELLAAPLSYGALIQQLTQVYHVDESRCREEVSVLLQTCIAHQLIRLTPCSPD